MSVAIVIAFIEDHAVIDRIINHLKLTFFADSNSCLDVS